MSGIYAPRFATPARLAQLRQTIELLPDSILALWDDDAGPAVLATGYVGSGPWMDGRPFGLSSQVRVYAIADKTFNNPSVGFSVLRLGAYSGGSMVPVAWRSCFPLLPQHFQEAGRRAIASMIVAACAPVGQKTVRIGERSFRSQVSGLFHAIGSIELACAYLENSPIPAAPARIYDGIQPDDEAVRLLCLGLIQKLQELTSTQPANAQRLGQDLLQGAHAAEQPTAISSAQQLRYEFNAAIERLRNRLGVPKEAGAAIAAGIRSLGHGYDWKLPDEVPLRVRADRAGISTPPPAHEPEDEFLL